jgi:hypothetical protein
MLWTQNDSFMNIYNTSKAQMFIKWIIKQMLNYHNQINLKYYSK